MRFIRVFTAIRPKKPRIDCGIFHKSESFLARLSAGVQCSGLLTRHGVQGEMGEEEEGYAGEDG
jgi:hypothetical protein